MARTATVQLAGRAVRLAAPAPADLVELAEAVMPDGSPDELAAAVRADLPAPSPEMLEARIAEALSAAAGRDDRGGAIRPGLFAFGLVVRGLIGAAVRAGSPSLGERAVGRLLDAMTAQEAMLAVAHVTFLMLDWSAGLRKAFDAARRLNLVLVPAADAINELTNSGGGVAWP